MSWYWLVFAVGAWPLIVLVLVIGLLLLFMTGTISVDGVLAATESQGTLTCWHCGEETTAGPRHCRHCGGELQ